MITAKEAYYEVLDFRRKEREEIRLLAEAELELINERVQRLARKGEVGFIHQLSREGNKLAEKVLKRLLHNGFEAEYGNTESASYIQISWDKSTDNKEEELK